MSPATAREFWKELVDNATGLTEDANLLLEAGSIGRAWSLLVLAQEELGKALWIYETFYEAWSLGSVEPLVVNLLKTSGRDHARKYLEAFVSGGGLESFWGDYSNIDQRRDGESWNEMVERRHQEAEEAARAANAAKQAGFYVDVDRAGRVHAPRNVPSDELAEDLRRVAQVIEMLLITDHSRMKFDARSGYDSTHEQHFRLLSIAHPTEFAEAVLKVPRQLPEEQDPQ